MRYTKFIVKGYRGIVGPLEVDVSKPGLMPIIGVNESGKTTVLHALVAFDSYNDDMDDAWHHLTDTTNLFVANPTDPTVEAVISLTRDEFRKELDWLIENDPPHADTARAKKRSKSLPTALRIERNLVTKKYRTPNVGGTADFQDALAHSVVASLPFMLFFDDFRDRVEDRMAIPPGDDAGITGWLATFERVFKRTDQSYSVLKLPSLDIRRRRTVLDAVEKVLNNSLTKAWQNFSIEESQPLQIKLELEEESSGNEKAWFLRMLVVEEDADGNRVSFFVANRSKGFYWFFNFVMKLEYNAKINEGAGESMYLLDEPGSYLHSFAQRQLCRKLRQLSKTARVIYCTHSHYLLDPEIIPPKDIVVAEKSATKGIALVPLDRYRSGDEAKRAALQPLVDALQVKPFAADMISHKCTALVEGIYDYYCLTMLRGERDVAFLPSVNAESIKYYVALMIAWQVNFRAVWDNDDEGRRRFEEATERFGEAIRDAKFRLLPKVGSKPNTRLEDLFTDSDLAALRAALGLNANAGFNRTVQSLFYSDQRAEALSHLSPETLRRFEMVYDSLSLT